MRAQAGVAQQPAPVEGRPHHIHVGQMAAAEVGIVMDEDIAFVHVIRERTDHGANRVRHRAEMDGQVGPLRHHLAAEIEHPAGVIAGRFQQWREGGLGEDDAHLLGDLVETVLDDLEGGGIGPVHRVIHRRLAPPLAARMKRRA